MPLLPNQVDVTATQGSQWNETFFITNADGTPTNITNKTFEFAIRRAVTDTGTPTLSVTSVPNANGQITVTTSNSSVQVTLTPAGTASLLHGGGVYALWMDPGLPDATAMVVGTFYCIQVASP